jgi:hypothetical protein
MLMHYEGIDEAVASGHVRDLRSLENAHCVKGCYRCLLSYYNQPDHELIDRTDSAALFLLVRMARAEVISLRTSSIPLQPPLSNTRTWIQACIQWNLPTPELMHSGSSVGAALVWKSHTVAAFSEPRTNAETAIWEARGFTLFDLPSTPPGEPPAELLRLLGISPAGISE